MGANMKKNDLVFGLTVIGAAFLVFIGYRFLYGKEGAYVQVEIDGTFYARYPLYEDRNIRLEYGGGEGFNELCIQGGKASVLSADCPDRLCVKQRAVSRTGESIICLPHKLAIRITDGKEAEYDGITG